MRKTALILLVILSGTLSIPTVFATNTYTNTNPGSIGTQVSYAANTQEEYTITVPALMRPGDESVVLLQGAWASDRIVLVEADEQVKLINSINSDDFTEIKVNFTGISQNGNNTERVERSQTISLDPMPDDALFGIWSGKFNYNVNIKTKSNAPIEADYFYTKSGVDGLRIGVTSDNIMIIDDIGLAQTGYIDGDTLVWENKTLVVNLTVTEWGEPGEIISQTKEQVKLFTVADDNQSLSYKSLVTGETIELQLDKNAPINLNYSTIQVHTDMTIIKTGNHMIAFEQNMTWGEWVASDFSKLDLGALPFFVNADNNIERDGYLVIHTDGTPVTADELIVPGSNDYHMGK